MKNNFSRLQLVFLFVLGLLTTSLVGAQSNKDVTHYVNPFIGADDGGNVFPGACVPTGMVKVGPDCNELTENAGWDKRGPIVGFSHTHLNGSGGGCKYGNVLFMPTTGPINLQDYASPYSDDTARVGLFSINLTRYHIAARLSATRHAAFHEYTFPEDSHANVLMDMGKFLSSYERQEFVGSEINILSDTEVEGYTRIRGGWNFSRAYTVYFYAKFDTPAKSFGTWKNNKIALGQRSQFDSNEKTGAFFTFDTHNHKTIRVKVGISYLGNLKARENANEISSWNIEDVHQAAVNEWNDILGRVEIESTDENLKRNFYSSLYRIFLQPSDYTGENPLWVSDEPYFGDYHAIWDTYRCTHPFINLLTPSLGAKMVESLVNIYQHDNYMPDARSSHDNGRTQGGSNCDILVADAYVKGLQGIDYKTALQAMLKNATVSPGGDERKEGRGGLADYNKLGYVSTNYERCCTRTLEYSANDYAIATVARGLGEKNICEYYLHKASSWKNIWNPQVESMGFKGFAWPRHPDASWQDTTSFTPFASGSFEHPFYETFSWEYSFYVGSANLFAV